MFELKKLSSQGIDRALQKVERYRLLNEPWEAESICRDVLDTDPENQEALVSLVLALTDQFEHESGPPVEEVRDVLAALNGEYEREYYGGIICERKAMCLMKRAAAGSGPLVYDWLRKAMAHYERAEDLREPGNDDALLRWNTCVRLIRRHDHLRGAAAEGTITFLE